MKTRSLSRRLNRAFVLAFVAPIAVACSSSSSPGTARCGTGPLPQGDECTTSVYLPCGYDAGGVSAQDCAAVCPAMTDAGPLDGCYGDTENGVGFVVCSYCVNAGRRSEGQGEVPAMGATPGSLFVHCASLEQASVHAFLRLARELQAHGAPASLVARARRAAMEETSHARIARRLARRFGGAPVRVVARRLPVRDLATVARENAIEGCVRETYGVLVAMWQARTAQDPQVRRALRAIARDEGRHADTAWRVAAWLERRLTAAEKCGIRQACEKALQDLRRQIAVDPPRALVEQVGLPRAVEAGRLFDAALHEGVFSPVSARSDRMSGG